MKNLKKRQVPFLFLSFFCGTKNLLLFLRDSRIGIQVLICGLRQCFPTRFGRPLPPNQTVGLSGKHWFKAQLQQAGRTGI